MLTLRRFITPKRMENSGKKNCVIILIPKAITKSVIPLFKFERLKRMQIPEINTNGLVYKSSKI